jgi:hypothetical protein
MNERPGRYNGNHAKYSRPWDYSNVFARKAY